MDLQKERENKWNVFFLYKQEPFIIQNVSLKKRKGKETRILFI
jgi:hypothetical protein